MGIRVSNRVNMAGKNPKAWGWTQSVLINEKTHVAVASLKEGGFSSKHKHLKLWNRFVILSGKLRIDVYRGAVEETIDLNAGDVLDIEPNLVHRMTALSDVKLVEIYWSDTDDPINIEDIVREDTGGLSINVPPLFPSYQVVEPLKSSLPEEVHIEIEPFSPVEPTRTPSPFVLNTKYINGIEVQKYIYGENFQQGTCG